MFSSYSNSTDKASDTDSTGSRWSKPNISRFDPCNILVKPIKNNYCSEYEELMNGLKCAQWVQALIKECYSTFACSRTFANVLGAPPSADKAELLQWRPRECRHARIYMVKYLKFYYHHNKYLFNFHNYSIFQEVYHSGSGPGSWSKVNDTRYKTKDTHHLFRGHKLQNQGFKLTVFQNLQQHGHNRVL